MWPVSWIVLIQKWFLAAIPINVLLIYERGGCMYHTSFNSSEWLAKRELPGDVEGEILVPLAVLGKLSE